MCYDSHARPPVPPDGGGSASGQDLTLTAEDGNRFAAYLATPGQAQGAGVVILPDVRGLHQFYKDLALRFAEQGIAAVAFDYFGRTAGLTARDDAFEYRPHVEQLRFELVQADVAASLAHLRPQPGGNGLAFTVGFCMGGTLSFLTGTQPHDLAGVIGFYAGMTRGFGYGTLLERAMQIKCPALGLFGGADPGIPAEQVETFDRELDRAGVEHEIVTYPGAPHSFFDRRATDYAEASADAWRRVLSFIRARTQRRQPASTR